MIEFVKVDELTKAADLAHWFHHKIQQTDDFCATKFVESWTRFIDLGMGFILKREVEGLIIESIGVLVCPDPHCGEPIAMTSFWHYTEGDGNLAKGLIYNRMIKELKKRNVTRFCFNALLNERFESVNKFLTHAGFKANSMHFVKEL